MAFVIKSIKPQKLKVAVFRLELLNEMRKVGTAMKADFKKTVATWEHQPKFDVIISLTQPGPSMFVGPTGDDEAVQIYRYVDEGTKPHVIRPKKPGGRLVFNWAGPGSYTPKTTPNVIGSSQGSGPEGPTVYFVEVHHPGTKARNFDTMISKKWNRPFKVAMQEALNRAARKSGNGV